VDMVNSLDDTIFKRMFRVDRNTFDYILRKIEPLLSRNEVKAINSSGEVVTARQWYNKTYPCSNEH
jgi:hypothetical protein